MPPRRPPPHAAANVAEACALTAGAFRLALAVAPQLPGAPQDPPWRRHTRRERASGRDLQRALRQLLGPRRSGPPA